MNRKRKLKILCLATCPIPMFIQGTHILQSRFPGSILDLFVSKKLSTQLNDIFKKTYILHRPFFNIFTIGLGAWLRIVRERYDMVAIFYNNPSGGAYGPVRKMAFFLFPGKVLSVYPDGGVKEVTFKETFLDFKQILKNVWLDGIIAWIMILALYSACKMYGFIKKKV